MIPSIFRLPSVLCFFVLFLLDNSNQPSFAQATPTTIIVDIDNLEGYELVGAVFGHYIYAPNGALTENNCKGNFPLRVQLRSPYLLNYVNTPQYPRRFFFYADWTIGWACQYSIGYVPNDFFVDYYVGESKVASGTIDKGKKVDWRVPPWGSHITIDRVNFPSEYSYSGNFIDKIYALMVGSELPTKFTKPSFQDFVLLAESGDIQAKYFTSFDLLSQAKEDRDKYDNENINWVHGLIRHRSIFNYINEQKMQETANYGSVAASYFMADYAGSKYDFLPSISGDIPFANAPDNVRNQFIANYSRAFVGGVFAHKERFGSAISKWEIPVADSIYRFQQNGLNQTLDELHIDLPKFDKLTTDDL